MLQQLPGTIHSKSVDNYNVFELDNRIYAIGNGFFDVLQWNNTSWVNLYTSPYLGYNFQRKIFTYNNEIYAIGGYGYWNAHSNLIKFDAKLGHWSMISTANKPDNYFSQCIVQKGDTIISFFGSFMDESIDLKKNANHGYILCLEKLSWSEIQQDIPSLYDKGTLFHSFYDLHDYSIIELTISTKHGYYILDKSTLEIFFYHRDAFDLSNSPFVLIDGNKAIFQVENNELSTIDFGTIDFNKEPVGELASTSMQSISVVWILVIVLALIIVLTVIVFIKQKQAKVKKIIGNDNEFDSNVKEITNNILQHKGDELSLEEINKLIGISDLGYEVRRQKRSKLIKEINLEYKVLYGKELITRIRDSKDKRHFIYKINNNE